MLNVMFRFFFRGLSVALIVILSGCGGGSSGVTTSNAVTPTGLTISGTPATNITEGLAYTFVPTSSGASSNSLTYNIVNKPSWASFNSSTGALTGNPDMGDIGITQGIVIRVSSGTESAALNSFDLAVIAAGVGAATLAWTVPTENIDGSQLMPGDLAGYKIYYGTSIGAYPNSQTISNPGIASNMIENLSSGTWFFVITAFNQYGAESEFSNVASKTIPPI